MEKLLALVLLSLFVSELNLKNDYNCICLYIHAGSSNK